MKCLFGLPDSSLETHGQVLRVGRGYAEARLLHIRTQRGLTGRCGSIRPGDLRGGKVAMRRRGMWVRHRIHIVFERLLVSQLEPDQQLHRDIGIGWSL